MLRSFLSLGNQLGGVIIREAFQCIAVALEQHRRNPCSVTVE
jgi:hypothetical protein